MYVPKNRIPETAYYAFSPSEKQILRSMTFFTQYDGL
jgi:hypothetical protein